MTDYKNFDDDELAEKIVQKYGKDWNLCTVPYDDPIIKEFIHRIEQGYCLQENQA